MSNSGNGSSIPISLPQPIAEFPDHYIRSDDIIRPKPRRLVDMRRVGVSSSNSPNVIEQFSFPSENSLNSNRKVVSSGLISPPPILPAKPLSNLLLKPVPNRPSSTSIMNNPYINNSNNYLYVGRSNPPSSQAQPQQAQYLNGSAIMLNNSQRQSHLNNNMSSSPSSGPSSNSFNQQRSVPNLPQLLQQKRTFLSPQPLSPTSVGTGSSSNLSKSPSSTSSPYYADLIPPGQQYLPNQVPKPTRVHGEWKSVENLPQSFITPRISSTNIDFGEPSLPSRQTNSNDKPSSTSVKNLTMAFDLISNSKVSSPEYAQILNPNGENELSPEYDRIRSPPEPVHQNKDKFNGNSNNPSPMKTTTSPSIHGFSPKFTNHTTSSKISHSKSNIFNESLEHNSITTLDNDNYNGIENNKNHALSTPMLKNKPKNTGPSSKLKSRRRNILQHLSMEEMHALSGGETNDVINQRNNCSSNTGTGGSSSSEASSGHASMTDSQTSGSPPAPADYSKLTGNPGAVLSVSSGNYKSVLNSVPEDETSSTKVISEKLNTSISSGGSSGKKTSKTKNRHKESSLLLGNGNSGLEDIKQAIEQLTLRSYHSGGSSSNGHGVINDSQLRNQSTKGHRTDHHSSYSTSTYSSMSGSECDRNRSRAHHLIRHSSLETINTQVTSADEFVWVENHNRLVELQSFPWSNHDILKVIEKSTKLRDNLERISMETIPRLSYLLQRALVRVSRESQRLAKNIGFCTKQEISSAFRIVLSPSLADSCIKACLRATAMFSVSTNDPLHRESKSSRAGLNLHVGRFQRWMCEVRLGRYVHEFAAIHLTAGIENLIEEILGQALSFISNSSMDNHSNGHQVLTAALLEQSISNNGELWGLLQPYSHLNAGRTSSGALAMPRWGSIASMDSSGSSSTTIGGNQLDDGSLRAHSHNKSLEQSLLTTCVGSTNELIDILSKVSLYHHKQVPISNGNKTLPPTWSNTALQTLYYFMRCSQLEHADEQSSHNLGSSTVTLGASDTFDRQKHHQQDTSGTSKGPAQELVYERPFVVLPPLIEWVRVAYAHADHRHSWVIDKDDIMQSARLLLPGLDCPVRPLCTEEFLWPRNKSMDEFECSRRLKTDLAFKMLGSGRSDLVNQALQLFPSSRANTFNENGQTPLILSTMRCEEFMSRILLDSGADPDAETPANCHGSPTANNEIQHWTALTFAALMGHTNIVKTLLEHGASVEGGAKLSEERSTQTPLQVASATGNSEIVSILLNFGANPFLSTLVRDSLCYMGSASRGSFSALSVAASHGQRAVLHKLLSHPINSTPSSKEVLSLEEILAEGIAPNSHPSRNHPFSNNGKLPEDKILSKSQVKILQEAMYQSAENGHLEITLDLRNIGIPWTLHCWINALATAHELRIEPVIDQLLQDFLQVLHNEDFSQAHFVDECLPLLFSIFRNSKAKNEGTTLLLADMFQTCYGKEQIQEIRDTTIANGTRIDPKYVNNPELSDVQFRVEGKVFYSHKIVLVTSSPRFKSMLKSAPESGPPILQINDIRYDIFQMVMEYLYNGGCGSFRSLQKEDILELMAAANFFQLDALLRYCETKCSQMVNIESVVSMYIHAKVYNAVQLLEYCQGFILQNMVSALTYDDSVRRLIFGKKLQNHDVLAGLLLTLQARLKSKPVTLSSMTISSSNLHNLSRKSK